MIEKSRLLRMDESRKRQMNVTGRKDNVHTNQVVCQVESFLQNTLSKSGRLLFGISEDASEDSVFRVERI